MGCGGDSREERRDLAGRYNGRGENRVSEGDRQTPLTHSGKKEAIFFKLLTSIFVSSYAICRIAFMKTQIKYFSQLWLFYSKLCTAASKPF